MLVAGVGISQRRGQTVALLDGATPTLDVRTLRGADDVARLVRERDGEVVAVDSPLRPSRLLVREAGKIRRRFRVPDRRG